MHRLLLYKNLELFEPLKILFFGLQRIQPHPSREIINEGKKNTLHHPWMWSLYGHIYRNARFPKNWSLASPSFEKVALYCLPLMHALQNNEDIRQEKLPGFMSLTMF